MQLKHAKTNEIYKNFATNFAKNGRYVNSNESNYSKNQPLAKDTTSNRQNCKATFPKFCT